MVKPIGTIKKRRSERVKLVHQDHHIASVRENQEIAQFILNAFSDVVFLMATNGNVIATNEATAERLGKSVDDLVGANIYDFLPPAVVEARQARVDRVVRERCPLRYEDLNGNRWIENNIYPIFDPDGQIRRVAILGRDITVYKQVEYAQKESEERYHLLFETMAQGVVFQDASGMVIDANPAAERILGVTLDELLGRTSHDSRWQAIHEDGSDFPGETHPAVLALKTGQPVSDVVMGIYNPKANGLRWININVVPRFRAGESLPYQVYTTFEDITDRKLLNDTLEEYLRLRTNEVREREMQYKSLFEQTHDAIFILNLEGQHIAVNQRAAEMLGYSTEEMQKMSISELSAEVEQSQAVLNRLLAGEQIPTYERTLRKKDGQFIPVDINVELVRDKDGKPLYIQSVARDITLRRQGEDALRRANLEMERAMRMKDEFLASMSHELRTPLTGILGLTEGLQDAVYGPVSDRQTRALDSIYRSGLHLMDLINDILDVSKLEAGKIELHTEDCSLNQVCLSSLQMVKGMAFKKNQMLNYSIMPNEITLQADPRRLKQILVNLLSNAIKFTQAGGSLGLEVIGNEENQVVSLIVWDLGQGIKTEDFEKLFHPFVQLDSALSRQQTGTGLGLVLVQKLVDLHGGSLRVESTYGRGSRFTVQLAWDPQQGSEAPTTLEPAQPPQPAVYYRQASEADTAFPLVLLVDDDEINVDAISNYLLGNMFRVVTAHSGWEFIDKVDIVNPDLILMDIQMPGMDGLEAIRRLRAHHRSTIAKIPVIATTALAMPGDREKCLAAGATAYLSKPVRLHELSQNIHSLLSSV